MSLRRQLLLVSLLTLVLPWAGCQFVRETESALREGQRQMLSGTAVAIAESLSQFPEAFISAGDGSYSEDQIYAHPLAGAPLIDGYLDDWPLTTESLRSLRGAEGTIRFVVGAGRQHFFLYVDARDSSISYATAGTALTAADHVNLVTTDSTGHLANFVFATEAPGTIQVKRRIGDDLVTDSRISAYWQDTANGYRIEARIPREFIGERLGLEISNARPGATVVSRTFDRGQAPGLLVSTSVFLSSVAANHVQRGMRLTIINRSGWRLARAGSLSARVQDRDRPRIPSGWQRVAYRLLLEQGDSADLAEPDPSGRERQNYVARALNNEPSSRWFRNPDTGRAVVAVAQPVWSGNVQTGAIILQHDTDAILSLANESLMRLITLTLIATVGAAAALLGYASWLSLRIRRLSHAADHALDNDQPSTSLPSANADDEIGDLSRSFSSVLVQLAGYNEYLRSLASKLSHEMRTPLTIVSSSLENLEHESLSSQSREYTERARTGARRLQKILNAMSEANRVEQLMENVGTEQFDLRKVLETTTAAYRDAWSERKFAFDAGNSDYRVNGSPELIIQMLDKLVDNAVDFSSDGSEIRIGLAHSDGELSLSVANPGPPLPETMRHRLFQSMVSVRTGAGDDNLGLGLNIAKVIAEGHGGSISAENTDDGVRFVVRLPAS